MDRTFKIFLSFSALLLIAFFMICALPVRSAEQSENLITLAIEAAGQKDMGRAFFYLTKAMESDSSALRDAKKSKQFKRLLSRKSLVWETLESWKPGSSDEEVSLTEVKMRCFELINEMRKEKGLKPFRMAMDMMVVADMQMQDMAVRDYFSSTDPDGKSTDIRAREMGYDFQSLQQLMAFTVDNSDPGATVAAIWQEQLADYELLMSSEYSEAAIGAVRTENGSYFFTQILIQR